jgi:ribosomal protein S18 acetylase RimI-like enzyme
VHLPHADPNLLRPAPDRPVPTAAETVLDHPVRASLLGAHAHLAERQGRALRYRPDVAPFHALPNEPDATAWADLARLAGPGETVLLAGTPTAPPAAWEVVTEIPGVQLVDDGLVTAPDPDAVRLGPADVPEMLALVGRTRPGPFLPRTAELGTYLGLRHGGELVAMAGERFRPPGWTEISAVCTDERFRGRGLATRLVRAVAAGIRARGETPFLHTAAANTAAIRLYESLGFRLRRPLLFAVARAPGPQARA